MGTIKRIKERRSIRKYKDEKVSHDDIMQIIDACAYAPSWKNSQIARYTVIEDRETIDRLAKEAVMGFEYNTKTMKRCPALVLMTYVAGKSGFEKDGSYSTSKEDRWESFDAGIAAQTFCLAAHELGIGTVILGIFDEAKVKSIVDIPEGQEVACFIPMGYMPEESPAAPKRLPKEELVTFI